MSTERVEAMICFETPEGSKVYVDPYYVAYVERHGHLARIVFSGGFDLLVQDDGTAHELIDAGKQDVGE
ncbi:MAG TPA: hypothetical protein VF170_20715 [Planctomycetaceae bacterium]